MAANKLVIAANEPPDFDMMQELSAILGVDLQITLAERAKIDQAIQKHYGLGASIVERLTRDRREEAGGTEAVNSMTAEETNPWNEEQLTIQNF